MEQTVEHLFRHEWGKLVAALTKLFGVHNLELAEDVVQDTLVKAFEHWKINGVPSNPSGWLYTVARNKAVDVIRQQKRGEEFARSFTHLLQSEYSLVPTIHEQLNEKFVDDDRLRMMFVCCHPSLSPESQVALVLKTLCGFSVTEIAKAFVCSYDTIEKRLYRARQTFREQQVDFELPAADVLDSRLNNVLMAVYLLFNEGYNSTHHENLIRNDLMREAMRLCELICRTKTVEHANSHALMALMCFNASRNNARMDDDGNILLMKQQDRSKWNRALIETGVFHLEESAAGETISKYHLEAGIAYEHARARDYAHTNWHNILSCYNLLQQLYPSPIIALNRAIVIAELHGPKEAIVAIELIEGKETLKNYYLLPAVLGEYHAQIGDHTKAKAYFKEAEGLTHSSAEKKLLKQKEQSLHRR
ncbi:RNA polymerase sigma factor [Lacibacter luteus]|uniref:RNA polymerase sigma factor n=1 Tax=Lacibacter luteus TaxID=2508719 RepID=UPI0021CFA245|nr:sigma-70 family RNA polymerase sigma factor [Lacibacter luteus]